MQNTSPMRYLNSSIRYCRKAILLSFFLLLSNPCAYAEWNPEYLQNKETQTLLSNPQFQQLKTHVLEYLKNSWCSEEKAILLMEFVYLQRPQFCAEIGVFTGSSLFAIASALNFTRAGQLFAIDPWSKEEATLHLPYGDSNRTWLETINYQSLFETVQKMMKERNLGRVCIIKREPSRVAVRSLPPLDFLHIDGNYSQEGSLEDVRLYLPKVKKGGYILYTNISWVAQGTMPRVEGFQLLLDSCEIIASIDSRSTFLLKKLFD